jgi:hypothetical protein
MAPTKIDIAGLYAIFAPSLRGALATRQSSTFFVAYWIASRSLSSGAHLRDRVARNDKTPLS